MPVTFQFSESQEPRLDSLDGVFDDTEEICDIIDAMTYCEERDIPIDGLEDVEEIKSRIRLHRLKLNSSESRKTRVGDRLRKGSNLNMQHLPPFI